MKTCFKCGQAKDRGDFYSHPEMADGLLGKCKECTKSDSRSRQESKRAEIKAYDRQRSSLPHRVSARAEYAATDRGRAARKVAAMNYQADKDKYVAHYSLTNAVRDGRVKRQPCDMCGDPKSQGHHSDYSKPLDVTWLCEKHHKAAHKIKALFQPVLFENPTQGEAKLAEINQSA